MELRQIFDRLPSSIGHSEWRPPQATRRHYPPALNQLSRYHSPLTRSAIRKGTALYKLVTSRFLDDDAKANVKHFLPWGVGAADRRNGTAWDDRTTIHPVPRDPPPPFRSFGASFS